MSTQSLTPAAAELLRGKLVHLEKYKNLSGVKTYVTEFEWLVDYLQRSFVVPGYPPLPPIAEIPLEDLLNEIKRRVEYHPGPIG